MEKSVCLTEFSQGLADSQLRAGEGGEECGVWVWEWERHMH